MLLLLLLLLFAFADLLVLLIVLIDVVAGAFIADDDSPSDISSLIDNGLFDDGLLPGFVMPGRLCIDELLPDVPETPAIGVFERMDAAMVMGAPIDAPPA